MNRMGVTEPQAKITVRMNEQLVMRAKILAINKRVSLAELIETMLERYLPKDNRDKGE